MEIRFDQQRFLWTAIRGSISEFVFIFSWQVLSAQLSPYQALKLLKTGLPGEKELPLHLPPLQTAL